MQSSPRTKLYPRQEFPSLNPVHLQNIDGALEGSEVGSKEGTIDLFIDGVDEGEFVGFRDGDDDGYFVGIKEGIKDSVGLNVGSLVQDGQQHVQ
eukprot:CAMPEP_0194400364 /NCGR_PEP_ID=MMETSP0174-20130528/127178_1 /TAXON_ID=216777 /ORGANISM="Proboscia alata, Strain PI-D3" /LENGTH=93 /DNA_ID=CAMNT_0039196883 /DNA_START=763 /DNA_END=1044 /DNA_ORIENTATION=-